MDGSKDKETTNDSFFSTGAISGTGKRYNKQAEISRELGIDQRYYRSKNLIKQLNDPNGWLDTYKKKADAITSQLAGEWEQIFQTYISVGYSEKQAKKRANRDIKAIKDARLNALNEMMPAVESLFAKPLLKAELREKEAERLKKVKMQ